MPALRMACGAPQPLLGHAAAVALAAAAAAAARAWPSAAAAVAGGRLASGAARRAASGASAASGAGGGGQDSGGDGAWDVREVTLHSRDKVLEVAFSDGRAHRFGAELLRVRARARARVLRHALGRLPIAQRAAARCRAPALRAL